MSIRILLSDADGTLFDFHKGEAIAIRETLTHAGIPATDEMVALYSQANNALWKKLERGETTQQELRTQRFVDFLKLAGIEGNAQALSDDYMTRLGRQRIPLPGAEALCRTISAHMPIWLITNGISPIQRSRFSDCLLTPYLGGMVISEEVGASKPDPTMLFEALRLAGGFCPEEAVVLGDSITADIAAANNAGIRSILFTNGKEPPEGHGATWAVRTLEEACRLILSEA